MPDNRLTFDTDADIVASVRSCLGSLDMAGAALFARLQILVTDEVNSASISQLGRRLRLEINPDFARKYLRRVPDVRFLLLHELYHVRLGHACLFQNMSRVENKALDALINAQLCRAHPHPTNWALLRRLYSSRNFPQALLRPPRGWRSSRETWPFTGHLGRLHRALYTDVSVTLQEILEVLQGSLSGAGESDQEQGTEEANKAAGEEEAGEGEEDENEDDLNGEPGWGADRENAPEQDGPFNDGNEPILLLGDHQILTAGRVGAPPLGKHLRHTTDVDDEERRRQEAIASMLYESMMLDASGPGPGGPECQYRREPEQPSRALLGAVHRALQALLETPTGRDPCPCQEETPLRLPLFSTQDRRAGVLYELGVAPLLRYREALENLPLRARTHLYLDVSGSMADHLPSIYGALIPFARHFHPVVHLFGARLRHRPLAILFAGLIVTDGGTHLDAVLRCLRQHPGAPALLVTDGEVPRPPAGRFEPDPGRSRVSVLLTAEGDDSFAEELGWRITRLPS